MNDDLSVLHIHGLGCWHGDAYIAANRRGLEELRVGIEEALTKGISQVGEMVSDGEGYDLHIQLIDKPWKSEEWQVAALPYTDQDACEKREDAVWPWDRKK